MRSAEEVALLLALLMKRSGQRRARISEKTIKRLSGRSILRRVFRDLLSDHVETLGFKMFDLDRGGYGVISSSALDGAPAVTAKAVLGDELRQLKSGQLTFADIRAELGLEEDLDDDE